MSSGRRKSGRATGGGGPGGTGRIFWGPSFGNNEVEDFGADVSVAMTTLEFIGALQAGASVQFTNLVIDGTLTPALVVDANMYLTFRDLQTAAAIALDALVLEGTLSVQAAAELSALAIAGTLPLTVATDLVALAFDMTLSPAVAATLAALSFEGTVAAQVAWDTTNLTFVNTSGVQAALEGTVTSAPYWMSISTAAAAASAMSVTIPKPSGTVDGDFLLAFIYRNRIVDDVTAPAGWTKIDYSQRDGTSDGSITSFYRFASGEGADYTFSNGATSAIGGDIHRILGVDTSTPVNQNNESNGSAADPVTASVTTTATNCLIVLACAQISTLNQTYTPPANYTERSDFNILGLAGAQAGDCTSATRPQAAAAANGAQTFDSTATLAADYVTQTLAIAPATVTL